MKNKKIFYRDPPNSDDFCTLFDFIWDNGIGNKLSNNEIPTPWTAESLEAAFDSAGFSTDKRTIQNWHSGHNKPSRMNMHALAKIISAGDDAAKQKWADALFATRKKYNPHPKKKSPQNDLATNSLAAANNHIETATPYKLKMMLGLCVTIVIVAMAILYIAAQPKLPSVRNIMFCDEARFSKIDKMCRENVTIFPDDIKMIYTSFDIENMPIGEPFDRRWYRNGIWFKTKPGHFDDAWEGYTWIYNPDTHDPGEYIMRIIIDDESTTGGFTVQE